MNAQLLEYCKEETNDLLNKNLVRKSHKFLYSKTLGN